MDRIKDKCIICFMHNVEVLFSKNNLKLKGIYYLPSCLTAFANEKRSIKKADKIICLTDRDANQTYSIYSRYPDLVYSMTLTDQFDESKTKAPQHNVLLFIGSLFPANYNGIKWFVDNVMNELEDYKLLIVGKDFENVKNTLERVNVEVIGTVDSLESFYYTYPVVVMPIFYGSGIKIKTLEAMMYGRIIVASDEALEGYEVNGVDGIYRCNSKEDYIKAIKKISERNSLNKYDLSTRQLYLSKYQNENYTKRIGSLIRQKAYNDGEIAHNINSSI